MRFKSAFLLLLVLCCNDISLHAQQQHEVDSLLSKLRTTPADTNKAKLYLRLAYIFNSIQYNTVLGRKYVDSASILAKQLNYSHGLVQVGYYYGLVDLMEGNYDEALQKFSAFLSNRTAAGDSLRVASVLYGIGLVHNNRGDHNKNLAVQLRALKIYELYHDSLSIAKTLNSIAGVYWRTERYREAINTYNRSNKLYKDLGEYRRYSMALQNLANVYVHTKQYDSAKYFYEKALELVRVHNTDVELAYVLSNLGGLYEELKDYKKALSYNLQSLKIRRGLTQKRSLAAILVAVGHSYFLLDRFSEAEDHLIQGLAIAENISAKDILMDAYKDLAQVAAAKKEYKRAFDYINDAQRWKDSLFNEKNRAQINELQTRYEAVEKDRKITLLAKENEFQAAQSARQSLLTKILIGGIILAIVLIALIAYIFWQRLKNQKLLAAKNEEIREINFKQKVSELEMKALRAQINPHFLFNCMNSINKMILNDENENASLYLAKFSKLVRLILENTESTNVSLENELTLIKSYIELEGLRFKEKIDYAISVDASIEKESVYLPAMVLQPFVENAIWHGLMHKTNDQKGVININIKEANDKLICIIEDNGVGREMAQQLKENSVLKSKSLGIKITEERLRLLTRERLDNLIRVTDLRDPLNHALGTRVEVNIPIVQ